MASVCRHLTFLRRARDATLTGGAAGIAWCNHPTYAIRRHAEALDLRTTAEVVRVDIGETRTALDASPSSPPVRVRMSRDLRPNEVPIESIEQLVDIFASGSKGSAALGVGTEHEKFGFYADTALPVAYEGARGIGALLDQLVTEFGWNPILDGKNILALERRGGAVTLEPGGQLELSGAVTPTIHHTRDELVEHLEEVAHLGRSLGQVWSFFGLNPWDDLSDVGWMPKSRYETMKRYLPTRGRLAHWMMKMTCTVQANFDYRDEADAFDMIRTCTKAAPLVTSLFANSPVVKGAVSAYASYRMRIWEETDPDRCGVPAFFLDEAAGFQSYVSYLLDVPMFFIQRDGVYVDVAGQSFRTFLRDGIGPYRATLGDWELHMSTAFPDTRLKRYIETRTADCGSPGEILALSALWKGLLYDLGARRGVDALLGEMRIDDVRTLSALATREGLAATWNGRPLRELCTELLDIAGAGLDRQAVLGHHPSEHGYLSTMRGADGLARSPGERFTQVWAELNGDRRAVIEAFSIDAMLPAVAHDSVIAP